ncbi:uncharacterized protein LOC130854891 [Hippopotamus amphibius kiboko]|uniref:uncharacterized protein LOC130854891 n=1 Tax=Hippopotamus amphibius kiboko TaxID=575201 RepID=UPI002593333D|nr:uncharacterized protein LOC130854891 [Hippopotamus amphibius kiboko]
MGLGCMILSVKGGYKCKSVLENCKVVYTCKEEYKASMEYLGLGSKEVLKNDEDVSKLSLNSLPLTKSGTLSASKLAASLQARKLSPAAPAAARVQTPPEPREAADRVRRSPRPPPPPTPHPTRTHTSPARPPPRPGDSARGPRPATSLSRLWPVGSGAACCGACPSLSQETEFLRPRRDGLVQRLNHSAILVQAHDLSFALPTRPTPPSALRPPSLRNARGPSPPLPSFSQPELELRASRSLLFPPPQLTVAPGPPRPPGQLQPSLARFRRRRRQSAGSGGTRAPPLCFRFRGARARETNTPAHLWIPGSTFRRRPGRVAALGRGPESGGRFVAVVCFIPGSMNFEDWVAWAAAGLPDPRARGPLFFPARHTGRECCGNLCLHCAAACGERGTFALLAGCGHAADADAGTSSLFPDPPMHLDVRVLLTVLQCSPSFLCKRDFSSSFQLTSFSGAFTPFSATEDLESTTEPRLLCPGASGSLGTAPPFVQTVQAAVFDQELPSSRRLFTFTSPSGSSPTGSRCEKPIALPPPGRL